MRKFALLAGSLAISVAAFVVPITASAPAAAQGLSITIGSPRFGPPPVRYERRPSRPNNGAIWINGHWQWRGNRYIWVSGSWSRPNPGMHAWVDGRWERRGRNWVWTEGHWN